MITKKLETKCKYPVLALLILLSIVGGCAAPHLRAVQGLGNSKRESLKISSESLRSAQQATKEQFVVALERLKALVEFPGGDLNRRYSEMIAEFEISGDRAREYRDSLANFEETGALFFKDWENELRRTDLKEREFPSASELTATKNRFNSTVLAANRAASQIDPILLVFNEQQHFLKNNVNAQSVAALKNRYNALAARVSALGRELDQAIAHSDSFGRMTMFSTSNQ